jgi:hypothetical protein
MSISFVRVCKLFVVLKAIFILPSAPFFVVMMITPFDAREPYMAVEEASFNTVMLSMSLGFIILRKFK